MMAQEQAIGYNELTIAQSEVEQYVSQFNNLTELEYATSNILHHAFFMASGAIRSQ